MSLGRNIKFVGHEIYHVAGPDLKGLPKIDNLIYKTSVEELKWAEEATYKIGEWRDTFRSTYIRWAIAINGLHVASQKYKDAEWKANNKFTVGGFRMRNGIEPVVTQLMEWDGDTASEAHLKSVNMIASYGIIDLYACFEELIFDFYRSYLTHNPDSFLIGPENKAFRKLHKNKDNDPEAWESALKSRLDKWQKNKLYEGLHKVFLSYMKTAGLEKPSSYKLTTPETWAEAIRGIAILRNCLTHGEKSVPEELAVITKKPYGLSFNFNAGDEISLSTKHLMAIELFGDQLLTALNNSIIERAEKELHKYSHK